MSAPAPAPAPVNALGFIYLLDMKNLMTVNSVNNLLICGVQVIKFVQ